MAQVLYRKWRPRRWEQVVGQEHVVQTLRNAVQANRVAHAYLFSGPRGTGKTSTARLLAKAVNCLAEETMRPCDECDHCVALQQGRFLDLIEIDAASNTSVDDVRDLREKINFSPNLGRYKVYIIDEVHMLSTAAFNALLKTLEEPPPHAIFVLATTEVHKIPATVLSRCQRHEFRRIPVPEIVRQLELMVAEEALEADAEVLPYLARQATGSLRDAISLLDQLAATGEQITLEQAQRILGTTADQTVLAVVDALKERQAGRGLEGIQMALDAGADPRQFARQMVDYLRAVLLVRMGNADQVDATAELRARMAIHAQAFPPQELLEIIRAFNRAATEFRSAWHPRLPLELAFVESLDLAGQAENPAGGSPGGAAAAGQARPGAVDETAAAHQPVANPAPQPDPAAGQEGDPPVGQEGDAPVGQEGDPPGDQEGDPLAGQEGDSPVGQDGDPQGASQEVSQLQAGAAGDGLTFQKVLGLWPQVVHILRRSNPQALGLLNSCKPLGLKDQALVLGFASDLLKSKMEKTETLGHVRKAFSQVLQVDVAILCVVSAAAADHRGGDLGDLDSDGMVAVALRDLGGEIVDIQ